MKTGCIAAALAASLFLSMPTAVEAAASYDNCSGFIDSVPATITTQGVWCLRADLSTAISGGQAITVATNNVTIDCNDFKLGGLAAGAGTNAIGIFADNRLNVVVRNCNVRGFRDGVNFSGGSGHVVEDSRFDGNTWIAIRVNSSNTLLRRNFLVDTGGSTGQLHAYGIVLGNAEGSDVVDNEVVGVAPADTSQIAYGIWVLDLSEGSIRNNRVRGLSAPTGVSYAVFGATNHGVVIEGNVLHGPAGGSSVGISCVSNTGTAVRNTLRRFGTGISNCAQLDNLVNNN